MDKTFVYQEFGIRETLAYPDLSVYDFIRIGENVSLSATAYDYFNQTASYDTLFSHIARAAASLIRLGVRENDRVSVCMPNTPATIIMFYAINAVGAVANMIHPLSSENEIQYFLNVSDSKFMMAADFALPKIENIKSRTMLKKIIVAAVSDYMSPVTAALFWVSKGRKIPAAHYGGDKIKWSDFFTLAPEGEVPDLPERRGDDTAAILYSGGTTGKPKGVVLTNLNFNALALQSIEMVGVIEKGEIMLGIMPMFHGFGLGVGVHTALYSGAKILVIPQFSSKIFIEVINKKRPSVIVGVPTLYESMIKSRELIKSDLSFIKAVICGGDSLSGSLKSKIDEFLLQHGTKATVREGYGLTECVTGTCLMPNGCSKSGSVGIPYPDAFYKTVIPYTETETEPGGDGEICISGPAVMREYLNEPIETKQSLRLHGDGKIWLHTGDLGSIDSDGYISFKLRLKRMIVSKGFNIYPGMIENTLNLHEAVASSTVVGVPDEYMGQRIKAYIVLEKGFKATDELKEEILSHCERNISKFSIPHEFEFKSELPKTRMGKIDYNVLTTSSSCEPE